MTLLREIKSRIKRAMYAAVGLKREVKLPERTLGSKGQAWTICADYLCGDDLVYSLGLSTDIRFDLDMVEQFGSELHGFEPDPTSIKYLEGLSLPSRMHLHPYGIAGRDGMLKIYRPYEGAGLCPSAHIRPSDSKDSIDVEVRRLSSVMKELGHTRIELLKMDIEGSEYEVIDSIIEDGVDVDQILIEFHHRFEGIGISRTLETVQRLRGAGYSLFHVSRWCEEYGFMKNDLIS